MTEPVANDFSAIAKALKLLEVEKAETMPERDNLPFKIIISRGQKTRGYIVKQLKIEWGKVYHIKNDERTSRINWCKANIQGDWQFSNGHEVYYFRDPNDASYFKLIHS